MRIEYRRTFSQFVDNYLAGYFGVPSQTAFRLAGGPTMMVVASLLIIFANGRVISAFLRNSLIGLSIPLFILGFYYMIRPGLNIFLVWLRREQFLGPEDAVIALELHDDFIRVFEGEEPFDLPLDQINSVWRRTHSAWIITQSDNLVSFPFEDLIAGDAANFLEALEAAIAPDEEEE